jgi:hypothetical protein
MGGYAIKTHSASEHHLLYEILTTFGLPSVGSLYKLLMHLSISTKILYKDL